MTGRRGLWIAGIRRAWALSLAIVGLLGQVHRASESRPAGVDQAPDVPLAAQENRSATPKPAPASRYSLVTRETVQERLDSAPPKNQDRKAKLESLFEQSGCTDRDLFDQPVRHQAFPNVICKLPGATTSTIIVGAHFDKVPRGKGVVDNWSGASLLPTIYQGLLTHRRRHTFLFIGFTGEEKGLAGSAYYVAQMTEAEVEQTRAMVNIDTLALGPTEVWLTHSDRTLAGYLYAMAKSLNLPLSTMNADQVGDDDSHSFIRRKIPTLMVHSVTNQTVHILHSEDDNLGAVKFNDYYDTYRLLTAYLAWIDTLLR